MSEPLYTISYFSTCDIPGDQENTVQEINNIIKTSKIKNAGLDVTGALLFSGGYFIQVLEGPESAVEKIFESIQNDFRHKNVAVIDNKHIRQRCFSQWSMALAGISKEILPGLEGILSAPKDIRSDERGETLVKLLTDLIMRYESESHLNYAKHESSS
ncbi:BLUF domain-containing protein [Vibrio salinus]|uniref:BLUF domain-containing protein n=1 Tax=Vibrio salinus TaxID=2899784 RepID=UPI001E533437|nr:BLUF domain-containing protein [Vibrio salinus]MCE0495277.1 BLUF domain-containing protein [Vibrio salinus]